MQKILVIIGTRPEAIKLFPVVHALRDNPAFEYVVCTTGQHREMVDDVLDFAGVVPDHRLDAMRAGQSLDLLTARLMEQIGPVIDEAKPDWVVVQGDTTSAFCGALAAYYRRVPVCHVEAGLRTGDIHQPWPEEVNRKMIAMIAALHCAPTSGAAENLRREGVAEETIHVTGNTVVDALQWSRARLALDHEGAGMLSDLRRSCAGKKIVSVTFHRRENQGAHAAQLASALARLAKRDDVAIVVSRHPNLHESSPLEQLVAYASVQLAGPFRYREFLALLDMCDLILTDSGGVQEEAAALGKPLLVLRNITERPEGIAAGAAHIVGTCASTVERNVNRMLDGISIPRDTEERRRIYGDGHSAHYILARLGAHQGCR